MTPGEGTGPVDSEVEEGHLDLVGPATWYRCVGSDHGGLPVVVLHGGPGFNSEYLEPFTALGKERRVVFYDQFGAGRSVPQEPVDDGCFSVELFVRELAALRVALGLDRVHILGQSWGSMLALEHVLSGASGVASLTLISGTASMEEWGHATHALRDALPPDVRNALTDEHSQGSERYRLALAEYEARHVLRVVPPPPWETRANDLFERDRRVYDLMTGGSEFGANSGFGRLTGWDVRPRLHEIDVPTLLLSGRHDEATPDVVATISEGIAGSVWHVLEESSHSCHTEETDLVLSIVAQFLDAVDRAQS